MDVRMTLRSCRKAAGLSQAELGSRATLTQSAVARFETGANAPMLATAERYAAALGLVVTTACARPSVAVVGQAVARAIGDNDADTAFREMVQFLDDTCGMDAQWLSELLRAEPAPTGDRRWDAMLAAATEFVARRDHLRTPGWTAATSRFLDTWWFPLEDLTGVLTPGLACAAFASSPPEFQIRGIMIDGASLDSV